MSEMPTAIFLDLDDTIISYDAAVADSWQRVCSHFVPQVPGADSVTLYAAVKAETDWYWSDPARHRIGRLDLPAARRLVVTAALRRFGVTDQELVYAMAAMRTTLHEAAIAPFPGAIETLRHWRDIDIRLALITNGASDAQNRKIDRFALRAYFDCIVVEGDFGTGKPDPLVFHHALQSLKVSPSCTWMIGDNLSADIAPAQTLGLTAIWHDIHGAGLPIDAPVVPDRIIHALHELVV